MPEEKILLVNKLEKISKTDVDTAGGKGASLGEMTQAGILVPPGFVILTDAFERFLDVTDLRQEIRAELEKIEGDPVHTVEQASEHIQNLIMKKVIPKEITRVIKQSFTKLATKYVAVRSSATSEDGVENAWAGQLDSFLNTTEDTLLDNVRNCWASLFTPRAIFYRIEKGLEEGSVAVVVQKMVESEASGIAFSVHPVTEDSNQLIIEACFGLGEAIVSGSITPDSYVVEKRLHRIIDIRVAEQTRGLFRAGTDSASANEWKDIPAEEGSTQVLTNDQILELSDIILTIENHYGFPCDVEWARESGKFYIVQSRPITTLISNQK